MDIEVVSPVTDPVPTCTAPLVLLTELASRDISSEKSSTDVSRSLEAERFVEFCASLEVVDRVNVAVGTVSRDINLDRELTVFDDSCTLERSQLVELETYIEVVTICCT